MKLKHLPCGVISAISTLTVHAQETVPVPPPGDVIVEEEIVVEETTPIEPGESPEVREARQRLDAALARQRLGTAPVVIPETGVVEETTTKTIDRPGVPPRIYSVERNVVIVEGRELPYLTIPVLFVEGTAKLLDSESHLAIKDTAAAIKHVLAANPSAVFDVEGHTSTDGSDEMNLKLSADRARMVHTELLGLGVPASALAAHGYGENYPNYPDGTEREMMLDRRVLVVRVK